MSRRLHRVRVEQHAALAAECADLRDGLDRADLVVGIHHRDEAGVRPQRLLDILHRDEAVFVYLQKRYLKALLFQPRKRVQNRVMLERGRDDVLFALPRTEHRGRDERHIVRLAAAGGEGQLPRLAAELPGDRLPRGIERLCRLLPCAVQAGGVAVDLRQIGQHGFDRRAAHFCCRGIVRVNSHGIPPYFAAICAAVVLFCPAFCM